MNVATPKYREEDGVIYFSVTSDGTSGEEWITRLESKGFRVSDCAKRMLRSPDFRPTSGVMTEVAILKTKLFTEEDLTLKKIYAEADERKLSKLNAEVACLIREKFTDKEIEAMNLWWIVAMHEPINDDDRPFLLGVNRSGTGRWIGASYGKSSHWWSPNDGYAFAQKEEEEYEPGYPTCWK